ncbi:hypothetical protein V1273_005787 [Bradyrhizobium sp. AZCC 1721]
MQEAHGPRRRVGCEPLSNASQGSHLSTKPLIDAGQDSRVRPDANVRTPYSRGEQGECEQQRAEHVGSRSARPDPSSGRSAMATTRRTADSVICAMPMHYRQCSESTSVLGGIADMAGLAIAATRSRMTRNGVRILRSAGPTFASTHRSAVTPSPGSLGPQGCGRRVLDRCFRYACSGRQYQLWRRVNPPDEADRRTMALDE